jgi:DNA-binding transcriptional LysR family regulator
MERREGPTDEIARLCREMGAIEASDYVGITLDTLRQMVAAGMGIGTPAFSQDHPDLMPYRPTRKIALIRRLRP